MKILEASWWSLYNLYKTRVDYEKSMGTEVVYRPEESYLEVFLSSGKTILLSSFEIQDIKDDFERSEIKKNTDLSFEDYVLLKYTKK